MNWIIPGKFIAFSTPVDSAHPQELTFSPDYYVPIFKKIGVTMVIRLNNKEYDREVKIPLNDKYIEVCEERH